MKRIILKTTAILAVLTITIVLAGCGSAVPERLVGNWQCEPEPSNGSMDTSMYSISIEDDGTFSLDNADTGKAAISGTMEGDDTGKLGIIELSCDESSFDPPECWSSLHTNSRVRYKTVGDDTIKFGYVGIWLTFHK